MCTIAVVKAAYLCKRRSNLRSRCHWSRESSLRRPIWNTFTKSFVSLFLCYKHSNNHRSTGMKVYSSDINTAVYRRDQNKINHLLESDDASNKGCINYNVTPAGGDNFDFKWDSFKKRWFIQVWNKWSLYEQAMKLWVMNNLFNFFINSLNIVFYRLHAFFSRNSSKLHFILFSCLVFFRIMVGE